MPQTHKLVRDRVLLVMRDDSNGFNAQLAAALPNYLITEPIALAWDAPSTSVLYGNFGSADVALSKLKGRLTLEMAPGPSLYDPRDLGAKWQGTIELRLVFRLVYSYRDGDDLAPEDDTVTTIATAIEDAVIEVFQRRGIDWGPGLTYIPAPDCPEGYTQRELSDGSEATIPIRIIFQIEADY